MHSVSDVQASRTVSVYFVASPLQYLAARRIAEQIEPYARHVLVWYKPGLAPIIKTDEWDACAYMPWPRFEPLPGLFGSHRRLRDNIRHVSKLVGSCDTLLLHSAVFDTEAINYFLHALPVTSGARKTHARILPDGLISIRRYPLNTAKRLIQRLRKLRRLFAPELRYQCFSGDRIGSDAPFCDRIYVLPGFPHEYSLEKVHVLPPLVDLGAVRQAGTTGERRALVIGQPLTQSGLMSEKNVATVTQAIHAWLAQEDVAIIDYRAHPKDPRMELRHPDYHLLDSSTPLETYMATTMYDIVVGVRSTALLFARQIYPEQVRVRAFGWEHVNFKSPAEQTDMRRAFLACGVELA